MCCTLRARGHPSDESTKLLVCLYPGREQERSIMESTLGMTNVNGRSRLRVLLLLPALADGGIERVARRIVQLLSSEFSFGVFPLRVGPGNPFEDHGACPAPRFFLPCAGLGSESLSDLPGQLRRLRAVVQQFAPQVIISNHPSTHLLAGMLRSFLPHPRVCWIACDHGDPQRYLGSAGWQVPLKRALLRLLVRPEAHVLAADHLRLKCARIYGARTFKTIRNPVVCDELFNLARQPLDHPWYRCTPAPAVAVGRLIASKGFQDLVLVLRRLEQLPMRLVLVGDGPEAPRIRALARELGVADRLYMPGFLSNPMPYIARASCFCLPSVSEGLPLAAGEAMALGVPVVGYAIDALQELCATGGGWLVPPGDVLGLAGALETLLRDPARAREMGLKGKKRAADLLKADVAGRHYRELIHEVVSAVG